jgi:lipopolysaccharide assembly protein A
MRVISWLFRVFLFLCALGFALTNQDLATLRFFGISDFEWRAPLVIFLLLFFAAGAVLGLVSVVPTLYRQRREVGRLKREIKLLSKAQGSNVPPIVDAVPIVTTSAAAGARLGT